MCNPWLHRNAVANALPERLDMREIGVFNKVLMDGRCPVQCLDGNSFKIKLIQKQNCNKQDFSVALK